MNINTQQLIASRNAEEGITIYNGKDSSSGPFWKGVVVDDLSRQVIARSFQGSKTVVTQELPDNLEYSPLYESTIVRFYRFHGSPMVSTHRQSNIVGMSSRVGNGRTFMTLISEAIANWEKKSEIIQHNGSPTLLVTPTSWEDLCVEGWCHVFILLDISNQKTNMTDISPDTPQLLYSMSLSTETVDMKPYPSMPLVNAETEEYLFTMSHVPCVPTMNKVDAEDYLSQGKAVVGYLPESKDKGTKYFSPAYNRKIGLVNESHNPVHRWHELMDQSEDDAKEYLSNLPTSLSHMTHEYMMNVSEGFVEESAAFIGKVATDRYMGRDHPLPEVLAKRIRDPVNNIINTFRRRFSKNKKSEEFLSKESVRLAREELYKMSYALVHTIRRQIVNMDRV